MLEITLDFEWNTLLGQLPLGSFGWRFIVVAGGKFDVSLFDDGGKTLATSVLF